MGYPTAEHIAEIASRVRRGQLRPYDMKHLRVLADYLRGDDALFSAANFIETYPAMARPAALGLVGRTTLDARRADQLGGLLLGEAASGSKTIVHPAPEALQVL